MEELAQRTRSLALHLGVSFGLFSLCRLLFYLFNPTLLTGSVGDVATAFLFGVWFDMVPVFYYNLVVIVLHLLPAPRWGHPVLGKWMYVAFVIPNTIAAAQNLIDTALFPFSKKRTGFEIFHLSKEWDLAQVFSYVTDFWYIPLLTFALAFLAHRVYKSLFVSFTSPLQARMRLWHWVLFVTGTVGITVLGLRGGFGLIPLRTFDAGRYVKTTLVPLTINTPFQLICTVEGHEPERLHFMPAAEASRWIHPVKSPKGGTFQKKNVVILIVESLGKEYMGFYNQGKGYTPFLDSLCAVSLSFEHSFANGSVSLDAPPAILAGLPHLMEDNYIISSFNTNTPQSVGSLLQQEGYNSSFYHGARNGSMGFDNFVSLCGMGDYFGLDEYPNKDDFDGKWGIFDEPYLAYFAGELSKKPQPFVSTVFTLSSHHPYTVPARYKDQLPKGTMAIHSSIAYTDLSLRRFFAIARKQPWFANTLFVLTADHTSDSENPRYQTPYGRFEIPIMVYAGDGSLHGIRRNTMQQSLLLPTLMDLLGYPKPYFSLGDSGLTDSTYAVLYANGSYSLLMDSLALSMHKEGTPKLYNRLQDPQLTINLANHRPRETARMETLLKAYLQVYSDYLSDNPQSPDQHFK